jgi:hypothetical protein
MILRESAGVPHDRELISRRVGEFSRSRPGAGSTGRASGGRTTWELCLPQIGYAFSTGVTGYPRRWWSPTASSLALRRFRSRGPPRRGTCSYIRAQSAPCGTRDADIRAAGPQPEMPDDCSREGFELATFGL